MVEQVIENKFLAYYELCKPRVVMLMLMTAAVGMLLAVSSLFPWKVFFAALIGIGLSACAGGVINQLIDVRIDKAMERTKKRPLPTGIISTKDAIYFASILGITGMVILILFVNSLTAILTFLTLAGYAFFYTVFLKRTTPQNIVIGGIAGAMPPLLGWTAISGHIDYAGLLMVLIIFIWTPPHFWALSIAKYEDYKKIKHIPMLPVTHGLKFTQLFVLLYTALLTAVSLLPFVIDMSGLIYLIRALVLNAIFLYWAIKLYRTGDKKVAMKTFYYSIFYLGALFTIILIDHFIPILT